MQFPSDVIHAITQVHPPHVLSVHFPIGLTGLAFLFLVIAWVRRDECLERAAFLTLALAAAAAVVAGLLGFRDNLVRYGGGAPFASTKIVLAPILIILEAAIVVIRHRQPKVSWSTYPMLAYVIAIGACFLLAMTLAFFGGVIVWGM